MCGRETITGISVAEYYRNVRLAKREKRAEVIGYVLYKARKSAGTVAFAASTIFFSVQATESANVYLAQNVQAHTIQTPIPLDAMNVGMN